jgi:6-phosphogluconolactonase
MVEVYPHRESLNEAAAALFARLARDAVEARGRFAVALSGGSTPRPVYERLARDPYRDSINWQRVHVFWGDERCVGIEDPRSNAGMVLTALLNAVPLPPGQIHPMRCAESPETAARAYEKELKSFFGGGLPRFDLVLLGLGEDGHTASLFPNSPALAEPVRWVAAVRRDGENLDRITLTPPAINAAAEVVFLVSGRSKAAVLKEILGSEGDPVRFPAQRIRPLNGTLRWLADEEAAFDMAGESVNG